MNPFLIGILISIAVYVLISLVLSKKVKTANDFYVAGRNAPTILIAGSLIASFFGTGAFTGDLAEAYNGFFSPILVICGILVIGYVLGAVFFGKYLRRSKVYTIPQYFGKRFDSKPLHILATIIAIISMSVYLLSCMQGVGTIMEQVTGIPYIWCIIISMSAFAIITILAGSKGVLVTDTIMFLFFTVATIIAVAFIANASGGWFETISDIAKWEDPSGMLSWSGNLDYLYPNGWENLLWAIFSGVAWVGVTMVGPWQSSRYLMAKNEQVVIRSTVSAASIVFLMQFIVLIAGVFIRNINPNLTNASQAIIWASQNVMPIFFGVLLITGILAAGMSSATTFMSLIGTSVSNDILKIKNDKRNIMVGRIAILIIATIVTLLAVWNPPQIFWIMQFGTTVIAAGYLPVAIASVWSKRVTKHGSFWGMLTGFVGCFSLKLYTLLSGNTLPIFLDPFFVGLILNIVVIIVVSAFTKQTENEKKERALLFVVPEEENNPIEMKKTKKQLWISVGLGVVCSIVLLVFWAIPYIVGQI